VTAMSTLFAQQLTLLASVCPPAFEVDVDAIVPFVGHLVV